MSFKSIKNDTGERRERKSRRHRSYDRYKLKRNKSLGLDSKERVLFTTKINNKAKIQGVLSEMYPQVFQTSPHVPASRKRNKKIVRKSSSKKKKSSRKKKISIVDKITSKLNSTTN